MGIFNVSGDDEDRAFSVTRDEVLHVRLQLDQQQHYAVVSLLKTVPALCPPPRGAYENRHVEAFLRSDSPTPAITRLESPPLFPRVAERVTGSRNAAHIRNASDLPPLITRAEDAHMSSPHLEADCMRLLEGESTFTISSPPSLTLHESDSEVDLACFGVSEPNTPDTSMALMDEVEIPRLHKPGAVLSSARITDGETIESFVSKHVPRSIKPIPIRPQATLDASTSTHIPRTLPLMRSPVRTQLDSMLGQPPSDPQSEEEEREVRGTSEDLSDDLDRALERIYRGTKRKERDFIIEERLDEKETGLMEVPDLPPPNASHPSSAFTVANLRQLLAPSKKTSNIQAEGLPTRSQPSVLHGHMKPVTGVKILNLELSWVPFTYGANVPTHEELSRVDGTVITYANASAGSPQMLEALVERVFVEDDGGGGDSVEELRGLGGLGLSPPHAPPRSSKEDSFQLALTKRERLGSGGHLAERDDVTHGSVSPQPVASLPPPPILREDLAPVIQYQDQHQPILDIAVQDVGLWHSSDSGIDVVLDYDAASMGNQASWDDYYAHYQAQQSVRPVGNVGGHFHQPIPDHKSLRSQAHAVDYLDHDIPLAQDPDSDKENVPLPRARLNQESPPMGHRSNFGYNLASGREMEEGEEGANGDDVAEASFVSLAFASRVQPKLDGGVDHDGVDHDVTMVEQNEPQESSFTPTSVLHNSRPRRTSSLGESRIHSQANIRQARPSLVDTMILPTTKGSLEAFLALRRKPFLMPISSSPPPPEPVPMLCEPLELPLEILPLNRPPDELINTQTLILPPDWAPQPHTHRYFTSVSFIQNHGLVRALSGNARVDLVPRDYLNDVDLIIDPGTGVLFISLRSLAALSELENVASTLCALSWRFSTLLIVLHAYNASMALNAAKSCAPNSIKAYTIPVVKAVMRLRRIMGLADGAGDRDGRCSLAWAFAENVREAALSVRCFAESVEAEAIDAQGQRAMVWGDRPWMDTDEPEGESDLARADGMNVFAAFVMLLQQPFDGIVGMSSAERAQEFSELVGEDRVNLLNANIERERASAENQELPNSDAAASFDV